MIDSLNFITSAAAQRKSFQVINALQGSPKGHQVAAVAITFLMMCDHFKVDPRDVLDKCRAIRRDAFSEGRGEYIRAIQTYIKEELK